MYIYIWGRVSCLLKQDRDEPAGRETGISLPNTQRQHRTSHAPKDVLSLRIRAY